MANESSTIGLAGTTDGERWVTCEIPGCANRMPYAGRGAPPKYCGKAVDGLRHTRLTAHRLGKGQVTLPASGSGGTLATVDTKHRRGEDKYSDEARPVTAARMMLELLLADVRDQVVNHEQRMAALAEQITGAVRTAADLESAAVEVAAGHRQARADIDAAEAERDAALREALEARRSAEEASERATTAEAATEEALAELEVAQAERDQVYEERDKFGRRSHRVAREAQRRSDTGHNGANRGRAHQPTSPGHRR